MATYREVVHSILETAKQTTDDQRLTRELVTHYVQMVAAEIIPQHYVKVRNGRYLCIYDVNVTVDGVDKYVTLPAKIIDIAFDGGVNFVRYIPEDGCDSFVMFDRTTASSSWTLYGNPFTKPSLSSPFWYLSKNKVYLLGLDCVNIPTVQVGIIESADTDVLCRDDDEFPLDEQHMHILYRKVLDLVNFAYGFQNERVNDGNNIALAPQQPSRDDK